MPALAELGQGQNSFKIPSKCESGECVGVRPDGKGSVLIADTAGGDMRPGTKPLRVSADVFNRFVAKVKAAPGGQR